MNLKEQLSNSRQAAAKFRELAEAAEARVVENTEAGRVVQDRYEQQLSVASQTKSALEERLQQLLQERDGLINHVRNFSFDSFCLKYIQLSFTFKEIDIYLKHKLLSIIVYITYTNINYHY